VKLSGCVGGDSAPYQRRRLFPDAGETVPGAAPAAGRSSSERRIGVGRWFWCRSFEWRHPLLWRPNVRGWPQVEHTYFVSMEEPCGFG
jgi:hypothetical protein